MDMHDNKRLLKSSSNSIVNGLYWSSLMARCAMDLSAVEHVQQLCYHIVLMKRYSQ